MASVNIYQAKTQFSKLVKRVRAGEEITIADAGTPVAKLVPIESPRAPRVLGGDRGKIGLAPDAFDPLTEAELASWYDGPLVSDPRSTKSPRKPRGNRAPKRPRRVTRR